MPILSNCGSICSSFLTCRERKHLTFTLHDSCVCVGIEESLRIKLKKSVELNLDVVINHRQYFLEQAKSKMKC